MELRILPGNIANMIAAGEVVQRPASVVKELVENSVDAGATQITVIIADSGRTLIQVIDNGCGMTPDDAVLCFERHATSKIASAEDLESIMTFGFRGEALASIAAVAEVTLKTRTADEELGCQIEFAASQHISTDEVSTPVGTNIAVRNLFYNIPARRKFLKSDNVEFKHVIEEFTKVALTRPEIGFTLIHNGKEIFVLKKAKSMKFRILDLLGRNVVGDIVDVSADTSAISLRGFVGRPDAARKTLGNQFFFVNGRFFRSPYMHKAVMKAYENLTSEGATPSYFIYLETNPHSVDVNISPTKSEVKFEDDSFVFQVIYAAVKEVLGKNSFAGDIDFSNPEAKDMPVLGSNFSEYKPSTAPTPQVDPDYNPFEPASSQSSFDFSAELAGMNMGSGTWKGAADASSGGHAAGAGAAWSGSGAAWNGGAGHLVDKSQDYGKLFEDRALPVAQTIILDGRFIVTPSKDGLMIINVRRARERILYDRALAALSGNGHVTQTTMFPVKVQVGAANRALFDDNTAMLSSLGFDIAPFGTDTVVVNGVPEGYSGEEGKIQEMISNLMLILSDGSTSLAELMKSNMAGKIAMLGASYGEALTSPAEARRLADALMTCSNPELTTGGKKIITLISTQAVEKMF
jgi:DNA mismatch repair protein MutL